MPGGASAGAGFPRAKKTVPAVLVALAVLGVLQPTEPQALGALPAAAAVEPREAARAELKRGVLLMEQGEYAGALDAFEKAFATYPNQKILFNIGSANEALARYAAAHQAMSRFLADPQDAKPDTIGLARNSLKRLESKVGRVAITSEVAGDEVFVDGRSWGATPFAAAVVVDPGPHAVAVRRAGQEHVENVSVAAGETRTVTPRFVAAVPQPPTPVAAVEQAPVTPTPLAAPVPAVELSATATESPAASSAGAPASRWRPWMWGVLAGVVVAGVVAAVLVARDGTQDPSVDGKTSFLGARW